LYLLFSRHWQHRYPTLQDIKAIQQSRNPQRLNYAWHRFTLVLMILTLLVALYTGLGMYKPVQFSWIVESVGGDWQALRIAHFLPVLLIAFLVWQHVQRVLKIGQIPLLQSIFVDAYRPKSSGNHSPILTDSSPPDPH
jgi:thiosulfate reductase cytochrome b subunit